MDRIIEVKVRGNYLSKDNNIAGMQGEVNARALHITFDEGWDGCAKTVTFWNALGGNPVKRILTADLLDDLAESTRAYTCKIPGEAMEYAGEMKFVIDGYAEDGETATTAMRQRSAEAYLVVKKADSAPDAGDPADPTPSQAEQLQVQIDTILGDMQEQAQSAEAAVAEAKGYAEEAKAHADRAEAGADFVGGKAAEVNDALIGAQLAAGAALHSQTDAERAAKAAKESELAAAASAALAEERANAANNAEQAAAAAAESQAAAEAAAEAAQEHVYETANESAVAGDFALKAKEYADAAAGYVSSAESAASVAQSNANAAMNFAGDAANSSAAAQGAASAASAAASTASGAANERVSKHNTSDTAHADIRAEIAEIKEQIENTVVADISTAVRMVAEFFDGDAMQFNAHNGSMILCADAANEATFTDRNGATKYLIPIPETATKVTVKTNDTMVTLAQFIGVNGSGGRYAKAFSSKREAVYSYAFEKGSAQWMAIDLIYEDTAAISVPWEYDAAATTTVTFTLAAEQGVTSWNDLTDKPFGEETKAVLPEDTFDWFSDLGGVYSGPLPTFDLEVGKTYLVLWGDREFLCVATSAVFNGAETLGVGNLSIAGLGEDTGEPFLIGVLADGSDAAAYTTEEGESHIIGIWEKVVKPLDKKFIPQAAAVDMTNYKTNGTIVETYADGSTVTYLMEFDDDGNPTKITDSNGNETVLTW